MEIFFREPIKTVDGVTAYSLHYVSQGRWINGFLVVPPYQVTPFPCIIFNRGGSQEFGVIDARLLEYRIIPMAKWGYVVIASQYSGDQGSEGEDEFGGQDVEDVINLLPVLQQIPEADVARIGMYGMSRGGMMTYLCLSSVSWIKSAVTIGGISNLIRQAELRPEMNQRFQAMFDGSRKELEKRSAVFWAERFCKTSPLLMMHGTADWRVSPLDSIDLSVRLLEYKVPHRLILFEGGDHSILEYKSEVMDQTRAWFDRFVKNSGPLPNLESHGE